MKFVVESPLRQNRMLTGRRRSRRASRTPCSSRSSSSTSRSRSCSRRSRRAQASSGRRRTSRTSPRSAARRERGSTARCTARAGPLPRARPHRGGGDVDARGGLPSGGGRARRPPPRPAGAGLDLRVRPRRAASEARGRDPRGRAAARPEGRARRRRAHGAPARPARAPPARGAGRAPRPHAGAGRRRARVDRDELDELVRKGRLGEAKARFLGSLVGGGTGWDVFAGCDLVLEAVFEEMAVKKEVFAELERVVSSECVLATNTSSLSVTEMGADLEHPERVVGMHFFNPVAVLPLVELVRTPETDDATLATAWAVTKKLRKTGVLVRDAPGFVVNRLLGRQGSVVMEALDHGNTVDETDEAVLRMGLPDGAVGPPPARRAEGGEPRAPHPPRGVAGPVRPLARRSRASPRAASRSSSSTRRAASRRSTRPCSRRSPTSRGTSSRTASCGGRGHRHLPAPRGRLPVLARRDHEAPRPDRRLGARRRPPASRDSAPASHAEPHRFVPAQV